MKNEIILDRASFDLPFELIENIANANGWEVSNTSMDEISVDISTNFGNIGMFFSWSAKMKMLQVSAILDIHIDASTNPDVYELLSLINEKLFFGHFSLISGTSMPLYRNSAILNGNRAVIQEQIHDMMDIAFEESYRYFTAFSGLSNGYNAKTSLFMAMPDCMGNA